MNSLFLRYEVEKGLDRVVYKLIRFGPIFAVLTYLGAGTTSSVMGKLTFSRAWELSFSGGAMWYQIKVFEHKMTSKILQGCQVLTYN